MRLIDADYYCSDICRCNKRLCNRGKCPIHNAPTAYDVDKVVEQLDYLITEYEGDSCEPPKDWYCDGGTQNHCIVCRIKKAIEIVKVGGKNE